MPKRCLNNRKIIAQVNPEDYTILQVTTTGAKQYAVIIERRTKQMLEELAAHDLGNAAQLIHAGIAAVYSAIKHTPLIPITPRPAPQPKKDTMEIGSIIRQIRDDPARAAKIHQKSQQRRTRWSVRRGMPAPKR